MENPCENCIIKCNCTRICEDKKIYGKFIEDKSFRLYFLASDVTTKEGENNFERYVKYQDLHNKNRQDKIDIMNRMVKRRFPDC